jgi:hypothetical protein
MHAGRHDDVALLVDAELADELLQRGDAGRLNGTPLRVTRQPALS